MLEDPAKGGGTSALRSISWHKGRGLILCATDDSVFAMDQVLQELPGGTIDT